LAALGLGSILLPEGTLLGCRACLIFGTLACCLRRSICFPGTVSRRQTGIPFGHEPVELLAQGSCRVSWRTRRQERSQPEVAVAAVCPVEPDVQLAGELQADERGRMVAVVSMHRLVSGTSKIVEEVDYLAGIPSLQQNPPQQVGLRLLGRREDACPRRNLLG
jgi:hypothetical protein